MTLTISLRAESKTPTQNSTSTVVLLSNGVALPNTLPIPENYSTVDQLIAELSTVEGMPQAIAGAGAWVADTYYAEEGDTLRTRRLRLGWSQAQLAEKLKTSQPHIARLETQPADKITVDLCRRLCAVFEIDMNTLDQMLRQQNQALAAYKTTKKNHA